MDVAGRLAAPAEPARDAARRATRCSSPTSPTSATSPASPARRRCCSCGPTTRCLVTDGRYDEQAADELAAAGGRCHGRASVARWRAQQRDRGRRGGRDRPARRWRPTTSAGPTSGATPPLVPGRASCADRRPRRGAAGREGRRRGGPHRGGLRHRRRGAGRRSAPLLDERPDRGRVRPRPRRRDAAPRAPTTSASRRSWRRARTAPGPTTTPTDRVDRARATSWSSTSAPWSTATTRT